jgi:hypothetical protein
MTEFYAKIVPMSKGSFKYCVTIWKSHDGIESIWNTKKFIRINSARRWAEKVISKSVAEESSTIFIKETDILRRKWNE